MSGHYLSPPALVTFLEGMHKMYSGRASSGYGADRGTFDGWGQQCAAAARLIRDLPTVIREHTYTSWAEVESCTRGLDDMGLFHRVTRVRVDDPFAPDLLGWLVEVFEPEAVKA